MFGEPMTVGSVEPKLASTVLGQLDLDRAVELVRQVCRIPSVLGNEGALAEFLASLMRDSGFEAVRLQPVLPGRPNALGELSFRSGPRAVMTGHTDTKPAAPGSHAPPP